MWWYQILPAPRVPFLFSPVLNSIWKQHRINSKTCVAKNLQRRILLIGNLHANNTFTGQQRKAARVGSKHFAQMQHLSHTLMISTLIPLYRHFSDTYSTLSTLVWYLSHTYQHFNWQSRYADISHNQDFVQNPIKRYKTCDFCGFTCLLTF